MDWDLIGLLWLNHLVARSEGTFLVALFLSDRVPWVLSAAALVGMWFLGGDLPRSEDESLESPRLRGRQQVLLVLLAAVLAFIAARPLAYLAHRPRPLVSGLPLSAPVAPEVWQAVVQALGGTMAFPSDHTAFWGALSVGIFLLDRRAGVGSVIAVLFFSALRIGLGYHYPSDVLAGWLLGFWMLAIVYLLRGRLAWLINPTLRFFDSAPVLMYPLAMLALLDITQRMAWLFGLLANLFGIQVPH